MATECHKWSSRNRRWEVETVVTFRVERLDAANRVWFAVGEWRRWEDAESNIRWLRYNLPRAVFRVVTVGLESVTR